MTLMMFSRCRGNKQDDKIWSLEQAPDQLWTKEEADQKETKMKYWELNTVSN